MVDIAGAATAQYQKAVDFASNAGSDPRIQMNRTQLKGSSKLSFPSNIDAVVGHFFEMRFVNYDRNVTLSKATANPNYVSIFLPVPNELTDSSALQYGEKEGFGGLDEILKGTKAEAFGDVKSGLAKSIMLGTIKATASAGAELSTLGVSRGAVGQRVSSFIGQEVGVVTNPAYAVEFRGVSRKSYAFSWKLVASSEEESKAINKIVDCIRWNTLPEKINGGWNLTYPNIAFLKFYGNQQYGNPESPRQIIQFGPQGTIVDGFTVSYNNSSNEQIFYQDTGEPVEVTISMSFQDRGIVTRDQIDTSWMAGN